jgi:hypothetical protein
MIDVARALLLMLDGKRRRGDSTARILKLQHQSVLARAASNERRKAQCKDRKQAAKHQCKRKLQPAIALLVNVEERSNDGDDHQALKEKERRDLQPSNVVESEQKRGRPSLLALTS